MPASTPRGYPYPLDTDLIDTAGDIQRLATAIDADTTLIGGSAVSQAAQIAVLNESMELQNYQIIVLQTWRAVIDARVDGHDTQIAVLNESMQMQNYQIIILQQQVGNYRIHADNIGITTDGNGYASVFYPPNTFWSGGVPVVDVSCPNRGLPTQYWIDGNVMNSAYNGFGSHWASHNSNAAMANVSFPIAYQAMGSRA